LSQRPTNRFMLMMLVAGLFSAIAMFGQSLADVARQDRKDAKRKPSKVYTNEDISELPGGPSPPAAKEAEKTPESEAAAKEGKEGEGKEAKTPADGKEGSEKAPEKTQAELEKEYRERFAKLRENLAFEQKKLDVEQREFSLIQEQYYTNPNVEMREQLFRTQINQQTADIEQGKAAVAKAEQAVADLEEELRKKGLPAGWSREP